MCLAATIAAISFCTQAGSMDAIRSESGPWFMIGGLGYSWYDFGYNGGIASDSAIQKGIGDGQTSFGRFALARELVHLESIRLGLELGIQSGNVMRFDIPQPTLDVLGGLPIQANIKPMLDLLATAEIRPLMNVPIFGVVKSGIVYRRMQINERVTVNDLSQVGFEAQAGLGAFITNKAKLSFLYQGIFDGSTHFTVDTIAGSGHISNIPAQNSVLLTLSYSI